MQTGTAGSFMRVRVSDTVLDKATRFFNTTINDIFNELLQNARRARASSIDITTHRDNDLYYVTVEDDGIGIFNDDTQIEFGGSRWNEVTQSHEDPAGMGIFSLAHRGAEFQACGLSVKLNSRQFVGQEDYRVESGTRTVGTKITFTVEVTEYVRVPKAAEIAALYYPLPVRLNGKSLYQEPFFGSETLYCELWQGLEIGVLNFSHTRRSTINFHGVQVTANLPQVEMVRSYVHLGILVNVVNAPDLKLVLPARKEVRQDGFFHEMEDACYRTIYRYIAMMKTHSLPFSDWQRARALGIDLKEAEPQLELFSFPTAEYDPLPLRSVVNVTDEGVLVTAEISPAGAVSARRAVELENIDHPLYQEQPKFEGYDWYDRLVRYVEFDINVRHQDETISLEETIERGIQRPERIEVLVSQSYANGEIVIQSWSTDIALYRADLFSYDVDGVAVILSQQCTLNVIDLTSYLKDAYFYPSDDAESDSPDTQRVFFLEEAKAFAIEFLHTAEEALVARVRDIVIRELQYLIPSQKLVELSVPSYGARAGSRIDVRVVDDNRDS